MVDNHLFTNVFSKIEKDNRLKPSHISLYIVLFNFWHTNRFQNPINISRRETLSASKINSNATYHKCIKELHEFGYIKYSPSYNPNKGSSVVMNSFHEEKIIDSEPIAKKEILIRISIEA